MIITKHIIAQTPMEVYAIELSLRQFFRIYTYSSAASCAALIKSEMVFLRDPELPNPPTSNNPPPKNPLKNWSRKEICCSASRKSLK